MKYDNRYIARYVIEASSPVAVGSGEKDELTDARVVKDVNQLPFIPASSLSGILRHATGNDDVDSPYWGYQKGNDGRGSLIAFTNANITDEDGTAVDGLATEQSAFLQRYHILPIRQHAAINDKGTALKGGKFDEEIVFAGTRFCFEMEIMFGEEMKGEVEDVVRQIHDAMAKPTLRIGGGTRCGFGSFDIVSLKEKWLNLQEDSQLKDYLAKSSSLARQDFWDSVADTPVQTVHDDAYTTYHLHLKPESFFFFGSGMGDDDVDATPMRESVVLWENGRGHFQDNNILIPATSVKGAIAHRVAYHYNKKKGIFADQTDDVKTGIKDDDVVAKLFGSVNEKRAKAGHVLFSDVIEHPIETIREKVFNHVSIDPFTGGGRDKSGGLYNEKVIDAPDMHIELTIAVESCILEDKSVEEAFESALNDVVSGMLPLGGTVNRGNGVFVGVYNKE